MQRFTISLDDRLAEEFDRLIAERGYDNRSEAVRDLLRHELDHARLKAGLAAHCVAALSYVYNHHERELSERLTALQHGHHDLTVSAMHVHLDHDHCLETVVLRGDTAAEIPRLVATARTLLENLEAITRSDSALSGTLIDVTSRCHTGSMAATAARRLSLRSHSATGADASTGTSPSIRIDGRSAWSRCRCDSSTASVWA